MTLGMWIDYIIEWNDMNMPDNNHNTSEIKHIRKATQDDFDRF